jgi:hypothetical protein
MKTHVELDAWIHVILKSVLVGGEVQAPVVSHLVKEPPQPPFDRRLRGPQDRPGRCGEKDNFDATKNRILAQRPSSP